MTARKENARPVAATTGTGGEIRQNLSLSPFSRAHSTTGAGKRQDETARNFTNGDIFQKAKGAVSVPEAASFYGYEPNRAGFIRCPFHGGGNEKTPSCRLWDDHFYCFACQTGGDVVKFTAKLFNLSPLDAVKRLNADFHAGLSLDAHAPTAAELDAARKRQEEREAARLFENWRRRAEWALSTAAGVGEAARRDKAPDEWTEAEWLAVRKMAYWDYLRERLYDGGEAERVEILRDWPVVGGDVERVIKAVSVNVNA